VEAGLLQTVRYPQGEAGFKASQDVKPSTEYITAVQTTRNYDVACWGFNVSDEAPEAGLSRHVLSVAGGNTGGNAMNLNNTAIDTQIIAIRAAKTDAERKAARYRSWSDARTRCSSVTTTSASSTCSASTGAAPASH